MAAQRKRSSTYDRATIQRARALYQDGNSPTAIERLLPLEGLDAPHVNTIKAWVRNLRRDETGQWSLAVFDPAEGVEPDLVLPVLAYLIEKQPAGSRHLTTWEARVITRLRLLDERRPVEDVWHLARELITAEQTKNVERLEELHVHLADPTFYEKAVQSGDYSGTAAGTATKNVNVQPLNPMAAAGSATKEASDVF